MNPARSARCESPSVESVRAPWVGRLLAPTTDGYQTHDGKQHDRADNGTDRAFAFVKALAAMTLKMSSGIRHAKPIAIQRGGSAVGSRHHGFPRTTKGCTVAPSETHSEMPDVLDRDRHLPVG